MRMIDFAKERAGIELGITQPAWDCESGLDVESLRSECSRIQDEMAGASPMAVKARMFAFILDNARLAVNLHDIFEDRLQHGSLLMFFRQGWLADAEKGAAADAFETARQARESGLWTAGADFSHTSPDWDLLLKHGFPGTLQRLRDAMEAHRQSGTLTDEKRDFYEGCIVCWEAVLRLLERMEKHFRAQEQTPAVQIAAELTAALRQREPRTVPEALKLISLFYEWQANIEGTIVRSLGRLDKHLLALYRADLAEGRYTEEELDEAIRVFYCRINAMNHPNNVPICLGGRDVGANELTVRLHRIYDDLNLYCPKFQIRLSPDTPDSFLKSVLDSIRRGNSSYVFANDDVVIPGLMHLGMTEAHAENYVPVGCYEHTAMGRELPLTCAGMVNTLKAVELALNNGYDVRLGRQVGPETGKAEDMKTAADFERAYFAQLLAAIEATEKSVTGYDLVLGKVNPSPLYSAAQEKCVADGRDAYEGGVEYNNASINCIALASTTDSLMAVRQLVDREKRVTVAELRDILNRNWEGAEALRRHVTEHCAKYGNSSAEADECAAKVAAFCSDHINNVPNGRGGVFRVGLFSIDWIFYYGKVTAATPDGRFAGEACSKNLCASTGMDKCGPTAVVRTATSLDAVRAVNGTVLDLLIHPTAVQGEDGLNAMLALLRTFCKRGGQCLQFNILDAEQLRRAQKEPEKYKSLQVRVCGWNAFFVNLSEVEQNLFIRQAEEGEACSA